METEKICPNCRKPLPPDVPLGLCPECLMKSGFPTGTEPGKAPASGFEPPPVAEIVKLFPQFEILGFIGKGGMGAVYKARQPALDRFVALKVLPPSVAVDPGFAERFNREARALARLSHPNIVVVYDFGKAGTLHYLVMEYVDGTNLREIERMGTLSAEEALEIVPQICEALQYAHSEGIVHRDIKPENLLIDKRGRVKIADFGIAKILDVPAGKVGLTGAKDVVGTPHYMAPEQIEKPQSVDHRADIYSLGVVFYEMLTGELPLGKFAPPSKKVQVDVRLDEVVLHTLEKEPSRRYQQASQVKTDVETIASTAAPPPAPPLIGAAAMAGAIPPVAPAAPLRTENVSDKIILPAFLLAFFFGIFGAHRFYVGKIGTGLAQLFTLGGLGIWATIDWILILCQAFTDKQGRRLTHWWHTNTNRPKPGPAVVQPPVADDRPLRDCNVMISVPAVALMVVGFLKFFAVLGVVVSDWPGYAYLNMLFLHLGVPHALFPLAGAALVSMIPAGLIVYGAVHMIQLRCYGWAIAAAILAMVFASGMGLIIGIWALVVLLLPDVRRAFENPARGPACAQWPKYLAGAAVASFLIIFMSDLYSSEQNHHQTHRKTVRVSGGGGGGPASAAPMMALTAPAAPPAPSAPAAPAPPAPPAYQWSFAGTSNSGPTVIMLTNVQGTSGGGGGSTSTSGSDPAQAQLAVDIGSATDFTKSFNLPAGGGLTVNVDRGNVQITGGDQNTVQIRVIREVTKASGSDAATLLSEEHVVLSQTGNEVSINAQEPESLRHGSFFGFGQPNLDVNYEITVPRQIVVQVDTAGGNERVAGIRGSVTLRTSGGNVDCEDIDGVVDSQTEGGNVYAQGCKDKLELKTEGGGITIDEFTGPSVEAETEGGTVSADFVTAPKSDSDLRTSGGNINVRLPENAAMSLDAHTDGGGVRTDLPVQISGRPSRDTLRGTINGGGPMLKLATSGGDIDITKR